jgi:molybdopterin molybdotransferase
VSSELLTVEEAQRRIVSVFQPVETATLPLGEAHRRVLAKNILAGSDMPPFTNSSMDGYAVRSGDTIGASLEHPILLQVIADIPAGRIPKDPIKPGQTARIMTGAMVPEGADSIIPVENTNAESARISDTVAIYRSSHPGEFFRPKGQDIQKGQMVLKKNIRLTPQDVGLLASLGISQVPVYRRPRVALLSSGDELIDLETPLLPGRIYDSNSYILAALIREYGAEVISLGVAPDDAAEIDRRLLGAVEQGADLIVTSAGVSVGAFDYVRSVIEKHGGLDFWRVNVRPGKPLAFGKYANVPLIGLPGNPVSAFVGFLIFITPAIQKLAGLSEQAVHRFKAVLDEDIESDGRESYLRALVHTDHSQYHAVLAGNQSSGNLFTLVQSNALLIVPSGVKSLPVGEMVDIILLGKENL